MTMPTDEKLRELLPCPWCGAGAELCSTLPHGRAWYRCEACGADGPSAETEADAAAEWNSRTDTAEVLRLRAALARAVADERARVFDLLKDMESGERAILSPAKTGKPDVKYRISRERVDTIQSVRDKLKFIIADDERRLTKSGGAP